MNAGTYVLNRHKVTVPDSLIEQEITLQADVRRLRIEECTTYLAALDVHPDGTTTRENLVRATRAMHLDPEEQLLLGGDSGLRGYPLRYQAGKARALAVIEQRNDKLCSTFCT